MTTTAVPTSQINSTKTMRINLWYCSDLKQWRWTLTDEKDSMIQESGQRPMLQDAMSDVATTVDYMLQCMQQE